MREANPLGPAVTRAGIEIDLYGRRRRHHRRARVTGATGSEELLHGPVTTARVDPLRRPQRVGARTPGPGRPARMPAGGPHGRPIARRSQEGVRRRADRTVRPRRRVRLSPHCHPAAGAGPRYDVGQPLPVGAAKWLGEVEAVCLDLQADPTHVAVRERVHRQCATRQPPNWSAPARPVCLPM